MIRPGLGSAANPPIDPSWQAQLRSYLDLPRGFELNGAARYVDELVDNPVDVCFTVDLGAGWLHEGLEAGLTGRNLAPAGHAEFRQERAEGPLGREYHEIPRSFEARPAWRM